MKKFIISLIAFFLIIILGTLNIVSLKKTSEQMVQQIEKTSIYINEDNWKDASYNIEQINTKWNKIENFWTLITDHFEIDNIEMSIIKSKKYIENMNKSEALVELESLKFMFLHIYTKEKFNLKNIF